MEVVDPGGGTYPIASVKRFDGVNLPVGPNVWQTPARIHMVPAKPNNLIHIFDYNSTGSYTITYGLPILAPSVTTLDALDITPTNAVLNALVNPNGANTEVYFQWGATTNYSNLTAEETLTGSLNTAQAVAIAIGGLRPASTNHFQAIGVNSAGTTYGADLTVVTPALPPPMIPQVSNQFLVIGRSLVITNRAQVASPPVMWSLSSAPAGASINPTNGVFIWAPSCAQGSSTNLIEIWATDSGSPPLSNSMKFLVTLSDCVQVSLGSTVMQVGTTSSVSLNLVSSVALTNLSFAVVYPANRFTNWMVAVSNNAIGTTIVQTVTGPETLFGFKARPGQAFQSPSLIGEIYFAALPGDSGFVPLGIANVAATEQSGALAGNTSGQGGRVVLIGPEPLLEAWMASNSTRMVTIYGNPGTNYQLAYSTNLTVPNWQPAFSVPMTNLFESVPIDQTAPQIFYRAQ